MTNIKEERQKQNEKDQIALARNTQANAGIPPNATVVPNQAETDLNNVGNTVSVTQEQKDAQAKAAALENQSADEKALQDNENLNLLKRIVGKASPIVEEKEEVEEQEDANGNKVQVPVKKKVTTGYTYYAVNGKKFGDWVKETFNGNVEVDQVNNKIKYNNKE